MPLSQVRLLVDNFDACFRFYREIVGLDVLWGDEGGRYAGFRSGEGASLALLHRAELGSVAAAADHLADSGQTPSRVMLVFPVADLDSTVALLRSRGVQFIGEPADLPRLGVRAAHLRDPDGNLIEFNSPLPVEEWSGEMREGADRP